MKILSNQKTKDIKRYQIKKYRLQDKLFLAEGTKLVKELTLAKVKIKDIIISEEYQEKHTLDDFKNFQLTICTPQQFKKISVQNNPDGILAVCHIPNVNREIPDNEWIIALDSLQDPGNLGTIIRIADWFGINKILCSNNTVDAYNPKVVQATMGSIGRVELLYCDLVQELQHFNCTIYGATLSGENIYNINTPQKGIIIIGNESNGISESVLEKVTQKITIPKQGNAESLNAGIAAAVIVSHFVNQ